MQLKTKNLFIFFILIIITIFALEISRKCFIEAIPVLNKNSHQELLIPLQRIFTTRNKAIIEENLELLSNLYDKEVRNGLWAYEHEMKKITYLHNWSSKQNVSFKSIDSQIIIRDMHNHSGGFRANLLVSSEYQYKYLDEPKIGNSFRLGTYHSIDIIRKDKTWKITREWYTDPFADSLNLDIIDNEKIREIITSQQSKNLSNLNERRVNAVNYANMYCGAASLPKYNFQFNNAYTNFNPQGGDCANFASQILYEGGNFTKDYTWNYSNGSASKAWVNAHAFNEYMLYSGRASLIAKGSYFDILKSSYHLLPGDYIAYQKKDKITHISVVTAQDSKGYILVNSHNTDRYNVPWDLGWNNENIKFWLVHVHY